MKTKKIIIALFACLLLFSACQPQTENNPEQPASKSSAPQLKEGTTIADIAEPRTRGVADMKGDNSDTIGWLSIPDTYVDDVVVQGADNQFYFRRNFDKENDFYGVYFADYRADFKNELDDLPTNTVIYGHAITDNPESEKYDVRFSSLHNFRDEEYVKNHPYIFFSTDKSDHVFEVMAVFITNSNNPDFPYNNPALSSDDFVKMVEKDILPRSIWNYKDVSFDKDDKFITLSTCIYELEDGTSTNYPKTWYRMGILGRLADPSESAKATANVSYNKNAIVDKDTYPE